MTDEMVQRRCPVCDNDQSRPLLTKQGLTVVRCTLCSMIYANPAPRSLAEGGFYDELLSSFYISPEKLEADFSPVRFERELRLFQRFCPTGRVLDVGCSTGAFLFQLRNQFPGLYDVSGMDVAGGALDHAESKGIPVLREPFLAADFGNNHFSAITFWAVLEHLAQPHDFLQKSLSLLQPGGRCFLLVPNFNSLAVRLLGKKYRYILPQHLNYFTSQSLRSLVGKLPGFRILHTGSTHFNPVVIAQDFRGRGELVPEVERAKLLSRTTRYKNNKALKPLKAALGLVERMLGQFRLADNLTMVLEKQ